MWPEAPIEADDEIPANRASLASLKSIIEAEPAALGSDLSTKAELRFLAML